MLRKSLFRSLTVNLLLSLICALAGAQGKEGEIRHDLQFRRLFAQSILESDRSDLYFNHENDEKFYRTGIFDNLNFLKFNNLIYGLPETLRTAPENAHSSGDFLNQLTDKFKAVSPIDLKEEGWKQTVQLFSKSNQEISRSLEEIMSDSAISSEPITVVIVPGVFGEFIPTVAFNKIMKNSGAKFKKEFAKAMRKMKQVNPTGLNRSNLKWYKYHDQNLKLNQIDRELLFTNDSDGKSISDAQLESGDLPRSWYETKTLDKYITVSSIESNKTGKPIVRFVIFDTPTFSFESLDKIENVARIFRRRLEKFLTVMQNNEVAKSKLLFVGYSRGTMVGLEMLAQEKKENLESSKWLNHVVAMTSLGGVAFGSAIADNALIRGTFENKAVNALIGIENNLKSIIQNTETNPKNTTIKGLRTKVASHYVDLLKSVVENKIQSKYPELEGKINSNVLAINPSGFAHFLPKIYLQIAVGAIKKIITEENFSLDSINKIMFVNLPEKMRKIKEFEKDSVASVKEVLDLIKGLIEGGKIKSDIDVPTIVLPIVDIILDGINDILPNFSRKYTDPGFYVVWKMITDAVVEMSSKDRKVWWETHEIPTKDIVYYSIGGTFLDPRNKSVELNRDVFNIKGNDFAGLYQGYMAFNNVTEKYSAPGEGQFGKGSIKAGERINDSQVATHRVMFWPKLVRMFNEKNKCMKAAHLATLGTHHWGMALEVVTAMKVDREEKKESEYPLLVGKNPFPRKELMKALIAKVILDRQNGVHKDSCE